jgi:hypothetical protein
MTSKEKRRLALRAKLSELRNEMKLFCEQENISPRETHRANQLFASLSTCLSVLGWKREEEENK